MPQAHRLESDFGALRMTIQAVTVSGFCRGRSDLCLTIQTVGVRGNQLQSNHRMAEVQSPNPRLSVSLCYSLGARIHCISEQWRCFTHALQMNEVFCWS